VNTGVNFGGAVGMVPAWGVSDATWGDPGNSQGWAARWTALLPSPLPLGSVAMPFDPTTSSFRVAVVGGTLSPTIDIDTTMQSATLVYQVDRTGGIVTVSPIDVTRPDGIGTLTNGLVAGAPVKVYGIPNGGGGLRAYVVVYFTGESPAS